MMLALQGFQIVILLLRGPHCPRKRWFGYEGGLEARRSVVLEKEKALISEAEKVEGDPEAQMEEPIQNGEGLESA